LKNSRRDGIEMKIYDELETWPTLWGVRLMRCANFDELVVLLRKEADRLDEPAP